MSNEIKEGIVDYNPTILEIKLEQNFTMIEDIFFKKYALVLNKLEVEPLKEEVDLKGVRLFNITKMVYEKDESSLYKFATVLNSVYHNKNTIITIIKSDESKTEFYLGIKEEYPGIKSPNTAIEILEKSFKGQFPGSEVINLESNDIEKFVESIPQQPEISLSSVTCIPNNKNKNFIDNKKYIQGLEKLAQATQGQKYIGIIIADPLGFNNINKLKKYYEDIYTELYQYLNITFNHSESKSITETIGTSKTSSTTKSTSKGEHESYSESEMDSYSVGIGVEVPEDRNPVSKYLDVLVNLLYSKGYGKTKTHGKSFTEGESKSEGTTNSESKSDMLGNSQGFQYTVQNKMLYNILEKIDKQIKRINEFEDIGMWNNATYFIGDPYSVKIASSIYKSIISGENSGVEISSINNWNKNDGKNRDEIIKYIKNFKHPKFKYNHLGVEVIVDPCSFVSSNELAICMGIPRNSVRGFPVVEYSRFAKEIVKYDKYESNKEIKLGKVFDMGECIDKSEVKLDLESLSMHTFVTGTTGSGKSNTIYKMLENLDSENIKFMVIEPAKGEYKRIFGNDRNVKVFGTNPNVSELLKINPFKFPEGIHILEHIDRIVELFNVCWPMYAAMPVILKEALINTYIRCGWDLNTSKNYNIDSVEFPTFKDLIDELNDVINSYEYSSEVKGNYIGSLTARIKSLTNGLNSQIFSNNEIDNEVLFDSNVIIDLSRVGSQETKSLIMGILIIRLSEYRMTTKKTSNTNLKHITVLEEAHNILKSSTYSSTEGNNVLAKSVEMLSNSIAEMRTYGEGFIIVDQSPGSVDISAIRNTNTKIIMRLPEERDRKMAGKSLPLKDDEINEISRLPKGVALVYQNDWVNPVLCKIDKSENKEKEYVYKNDIYISTRRKMNTLLINFILNTGNKIDVKEIEKAIDNFEGKYITKMKLKNLLKEYNQNNKLFIWNKENDKSVLKIILEILNLEDVVNLKHLNNIILNNIISQKFERVSDEVLKKIKNLLKNNNQEV